jgi:hypothetical protein
VGVTCQEWAPDLPPTGNRDQDQAQDPNAEGDEHAESNLFGCPVADALGPDGENDSREAEFFKFYDAPDAESKTKVEDD